MVSGKCSVKDLIQVKGAKEFLSQDSLGGVCFIEDCWRFVSYCPDKKNFDQSRRENTNFSL